MSDLKSKNEGMKSNSESNDLRLISLEQNNKKAWI